MPNQYADHACFCHTDSVAYRQVADELLLVPIRTDPAQKLGICSLNETGAEIWQAIGEAQPVGEIVSQLVARFAVSPAQARSDLEVFLTDLQALGAISLRDTREGR